MTLIPVPRVVAPTVAERRALARAQDHRLTPPSPSERRGLSQLFRALLGGSGGGGGSNGFYQSLTVDHTKLGSSDLTNYPVLLSVTDAKYKSVSNGGHVTRTDGLDIWVTTTSNGVTKIPFELLYYSPSTGQIVMYIRGSSVSHTVDTLIGYLRYGSSTVTTDQSDPTNTWAAFRSVVHTTYGNSLTPSGTDASQNSKGCALTNSPTAGTGKILQGLNINGNVGGGAFLHYTPTGGLFPSAPTAYTWSIWFKATSIPGSSAPAAVIKDATNDALGFSWSHNNASFRQAAYQQNASSTYFSAKLTSTLSAGTYYLIAGEWDGSNLRCYLNGTAEATTAVASIHAVGAATDVGFEPGVVEEIRVATTALGASWLTADYNNQNSPSAFVSIGTETAL